MSSAATPAAAAADDARARRRHEKPPVTRRAGLQLLIGVLIVGAIPVVSTARILDANALRNERGRADAALRTELQNALRELGDLGDDASTRAEDLARSPVVQRAMIAGDRATLKRLARVNPGTSFYLHGRRVGGRAGAAAAQRSVWLTVDSSRVGKVVVGVGLDQPLARRLRRHAPHGNSDRLVFAAGGKILGSGRPLRTEGATVTIGDISYRGIPALVPDATGIRLLALRPERTIEATVAPYQRRILYAAIGSFALLALVALLFAGPILRLLGDFRRVASQASTDALTGLANRRMLDEELALEWRRADRVGSSLAFVLVDLDNFKAVNDTHGHQAGDSVLRSVGTILAGGVRQVDLAGRYGGEEFALILPDTDLEGAQTLAERLRARLAETRIELPEGGRLTTTASFGVAAKGELPSADSLVASADEALYEAKRAGKNRVVPEPAPELRVEATKPERRTRKPAAKHASVGAATKKAPATKKTPAKSTKPTAARRKPVPRRPAEGEA
jgi:diguanylate cyclase (GGDEF)-like protein